MFLTLRGITKRFGPVTAVRNVDLEVPRGAFVCFLGPSGCGKTTLLRIVAGLETPDEGDVLLEGRSLSGTPARLRNFGMVFQSYSLFPNMTVAENIAYGLASRRQRREAIAARVAEMLSLVHLEDQRDKYPHQLSGGQQQRVALARALAIEPPVLLLDEPLSALDAKVREDLRVEIRALQTELGITTIMVTHDQDEAMEMADTIVLMNEGVIEQRGAAVDLYRAPANRFVAEFIGRMNVLSITGGALAGLAETLGLADVAAGARLVGVRPEHIEVLDGHAGEGMVLTGEVERAVFLGNVTRLLVAVEGQRLLVEIQGEARSVASGSRLRLRIPRESVHLFESRPI